MLRRTARPFAPLQQYLPAKPGASHRSASTSSAPPPNGDPPRPSWISAATIYPFILLSAMTSLAVNLSYQRTARATETSHLTAQISVLESLLARVRERKQLSDAEQEDIERELELVGLGRGKGKEAVSAEAGAKAPTSWREVFLGKKGKEFEEKDDTDWEKVFREADEAEQARAAGTLAAPTEPLSTDAKSVPTPVLVAPAPVLSSPAPSSVPPPTQGKASQSTAIYL
ncbi:hypothetical protein JCM1840_000101 [Sporobolomyces johnsonii]